MLRSLSRLFQTAGGQTDDSTVFPPRGARQATGMEERYVASMVLSGVGDALGYRSGTWEFCRSGEKIAEELAALGGLASLHLTRSGGWPVSDDTVMHLATAEALVNASARADAVGPDGPLYPEIARCYKACMSDMNGRAPGLTCMSGARSLRPSVRLGWTTPFNPHGGGCGAAMRSMCVGLRYPSPRRLAELVAVSVECGRMTHHHPTGYLGSLASALFAAYAVAGKPAREWGAGLMATLPLAAQYVRDAGRDVDENIAAWSYFEDSWRRYLDIRGISDGASEPSFPAAHGTVAGRDAFYKTLSHSGWAGASGHDSTMVAYDAVLSAGDSWSELCERGALHGGDSDSTGAIAACWWGAVYGLAGVPAGHHQQLEYRSRLEMAGRELFKLARKDCGDSGVGV
ncbi:ADP-ribosylarginine hydrolase [Lampetra fluviatilis]